MHLQAAVERVLGTVTGGVLGYVLSIFNDAQPFYEEPFITVFAVAGVGFASVLLGNRLQLDYAGRLFIMTFILVAMAAPTKAGMLRASLPKSARYIASDLGSGLITWLACLSDVQPANSDQFVSVNAIRWTHNTHKARK